MVGEADTACLRLELNPIVGFYALPLHTSTLPSQPTLCYFSFYQLILLWLHSVHSAHFAVDCSVFFCNTHFCASINWQCRDFWSRVVSSVWLGGDHFVADFSRPAIALLARKPSQVQMHRNPVALKTIQLRSHDETSFHWNPAHLNQKMQGTYKKLSQINN